MVEGSQEFWYLWPASRSRALKRPYIWLFWCRFSATSHLDDHEAYTSNAKYIPNITYSICGQKLKMSWPSLSLCWVDLSNLYGYTVLRPIYWYVRFCSGIYALILLLMMSRNGKDFRSVQVFWAFTFCKSRFEFVLLVTSWSINDLIHTELLTLITKLKSLQLQLLF